MFSTQMYILAGFKSNFYTDVNAAVKVKTFSIPELCLKVKLNMM